MYPRRMSEGNGKSGVHCTVPSWVSLERVAGVNDDDQRRRRSCRSTLGYLIHLLTPSLKFSEPLTYPLTSTFKRLQYPCESCGYLSQSSKYLTVIHWLSLPKIAASRGPNLHSEPRCLQLRCFTCVPGLQNSELQSCSGTRYEEMWGRIGEYFDITPWLVRAEDLELSL